MLCLRSIKLRKRYRKLLILTQVLAIWYSTLIIVGVLTTNTFAYISDAHPSTVSISSGKWWDGSDLAFIGEKNTENIKECAPTEISIEIENKGFDMTDSTEYEVYFIENGNPKENGKKIVDGEIQPIKAGHTETLTLPTVENGSYVFKVYQVRGYKDNFEERKEIWSKKFMVNCNASKQGEDTEQEDLEMIPDEADQLKEQQEETVTEGDKASPKIESNKEGLDTPEIKDNEENTKATDDIPKEDINKSDEQIIENKIEKIEEVKEIPKKETKDESIELEKGEV